MEKRYCGICGEDTEVEVVTDRESFGTDKPIDCCVICGVPYEVS